jgi:hypothetical protein
VRSEAEIKQELKKIKTVLAEKKKELIRAINEERFDEAFVLLVGLANIKCQNEFLEAVLR